MFIATTSTFVESLQHITGFILVMLVLTALWGLTILIGRAFNTAESVQAKPAPAAASELAPRAAPTEQTSGMSEDEVAAIAATVTLLMGRRSRIVSIRSGSAKDWSREGRREHFASHKIR